MQPQPVGYKRLIVGALTLILLIVSLTLLVRSPLGKPQPVIIPGEWTIEKAMSPLLFGFAGHNYLILRNGSGHVLAELHGAASDPSLTHMVKISLVPGRKLKVFEFRYDASDHVQEPVPGKTVFHGSEADASRLWNRALSCGDTINAMNLDYPALGVNFREPTINSNSIASSILRCTGLNSPSVGLITPGAKTLVTP